MEIEILYDGKVVKTVKVNSSNLFSFDNKFVLEGKDVTTGKHKVEIRRKGNGPVYFNSYLSYFSLEDHISKAGLEVKVTRKFYKLEKVAKTSLVKGGRGQAVNQKVEKYKRIAITTDTVLKSGDLVEIEMIVDSKNDYEYLLLIDKKAAGFEPVDLRSGYNGNELGAYVEFRDEEVCFFVNRLARGRYSVTYRMRAEIPVKFSSLPAKIEAMYAPELKGNSNEMKIKIED